MFEKLTVNGTSSVAVTHRLLDKAIVYAKSSISPNNFNLPALTPRRWIWRLAGSYHVSYPIPQLMEEAAERFACAGRQSLSQWATQKAREEQDHEQLALLDIQSMGYEAPSVVKALIPPAAVALIDVCTQSVQSADSLECLGYCYALERLATGIGKEYIQAVEAKLPPGINATRYLYVHSRLGSEIEHMEATLRMLADLTHEEQLRVANACYKTALICFSPPREDYISEEELDNVLRPLKLCTPTSKS
jgi:hypothetical protein